MSPGRLRRAVTDDDPTADGPARGGSTDDGPVPDDDWRAIVEHVPLVSVDLLVRDGSGVVLGERTNEPAKGEWFVPGGTVFKGERLEEAVHRVAREELGTDVDVEERLGTYEHFYETSDVPGVDGKQYLATAFVVTPVGSGTGAAGSESESGPESRSDATPWTAAPGDDQHAEFRTVEGDEEGLHPYVRRYLRDAGFVDGPDGEG